jgi:hypothetical protein
MGLNFGCGGVGSIVGALDVSVGGGSMSTLDSLGRGTADHGGG